MTETPDTPLRRGPPAPGVLDRVFGPVSEAASAIGTVWFFALMVLICAEVIAREFFQSPIRGVTEIVAYSLVGATFLQVGSAFRSGRMTRVDFVLGIFERRAPLVRSILEIVISLLGIIVMILMIQAGWPKLTRAYQETELVGIPGAFSFQVWPLRLLVILGSAMATVALILHALSVLRTEFTEGTIAKSLILVIALAAICVAWHLGFTAAMDAGWSNFSIGAGAALVLVLMVLMGLHVGIAMILVGFVALWLIKGRIALPYAMLGIAGNEYLANYFFSAVPLFVLMGLVVSAANIGRETFAVARWLTRPIRGGLGIATVAANTIFAAITGSSIASATVFAKIASPEMIRHGYDRRFAVGVVAGSSVLGMLVPPSLLLIVYGFLAEQSVGHLFVAAIVPGLILAFAMCLMIWMRAWLWPHKVFANATKDEGSAEQQDMSASRAAVLLAPVLGLIVLVLGGIYNGFFTPTEGGAVGSAGALTYAFARGRLDRTALWRVMVETGQIATTVLFLILAANIFTIMLASSGFVQQVGGMINGLGLHLWQFALIYVLLLVALGMFLESVSIMLIVVPIALPTALLLGGDPIWFGILTVIAVEIGLLTPPFGLTCYVVSSTLRGAGITLSDIFVGALPFVWVMGIVTLLLIAIPSLATFVP